VFELDTIRAYRSWALGFGKVIRFEATQKIASLIPVNRKIATTPVSSLTTTDKKTTLAASAFNDEGSKMNQVENKSKLFECEYDACIRKYQKFGNLLRHIAIGDHLHRAERLTLNDFAITTFKSKLDAVESRQLLSFDLEKESFDPTEYNHLPKLALGWALPPPRSTQRLTPRQRQFLMEKFRDGLTRGVRWKPEDVASEIKTATDPKSGHFTFAVSEFLKVSTIRSFFSRQKATKSPGANFSHTAAAPTTNSSSDMDEGDEADEEETMRDELAIDFELVRKELTENINRESQDTAYTTSKRPLSSIQNDYSTEQRKSPRLQRKDIQK
jgi:hypothetical protein